MRIPTRSWSLMAATAALMAWPSIASACEGCKSSAQDDGTPNAIGQAFGISVYFMLAVPMIIVALLVRGIIRRCREMEREHAQLIAPLPTRPEPVRLDNLGDAVPAR